METATAITLFGIKFLPHTWPLVFGLGGTWLLCVLIMVGAGLYHGIKAIK